MPNVIPDEVPALAEPVLDPTSVSSAEGRLEEVTSVPRRTTRKQTSYKIPEGADPAKYYREKGKPPLTKQYRVTAKHGGKVFCTHTCHAVDESEAIAFTAAAASIKASLQHQFTFLVVCL